MPSRRTVLSLVAMSLALAACTTGTSSSGPAPGGSWTQTADGRVAVSAAGLPGYSVVIPAGWGVTPAAPAGQASVEIAPRDGGAAAQIGIVRHLAGETAEQAAVRLASRVAPTRDASRPAEALAPIPLQSGGGRRAQVFAIPQRATERVIVVSLIADAGAWAYQILNASSRAAYDRSMPLMRNIVASYRPEAR